MMEYQGTSEKNNNPFSGEQITALSNDSLKASISLRNYAIRTPLVKCQWLSNESRQVWFKLECQQLTGSFKLRGAYNALSKLSPSDLVVTASAGNHGLAIAQVAKDLGLQARIFVPMAASEIKVRRLAAMGAEVVPAGQDVAEAAMIAKRQAEHSGGHYISPFDHHDVVVGQGSLAYEVASQHLEGFDHIMIPFGGGGLFTGIGCAATHVWPNAELHGIVPEIFDRGMLTCFNAQGMTQKVVPTIADGLAIQHEDNNWLWPVIESLNGVFHSATEKEIKAAMFSLLNQESLLCEGAAAIAITPLLKSDCELTGNILVVLSGSNVPPSVLGKALSADIDDPYLRKLNGLRGNELGIERAFSAMPNNDSESKFSHSELSFAPDAQGDTASHWLRLVQHLERATSELGDILQRHDHYVRRHNLRDDSYAIAFVEKTLTDLSALLRDCRLPKLSMHQVRERYRLAIQQYGLAKTALSWSSASVEQSGEIMFFDPAELQPGAVNYDRYGGALLREKELQLIEVLGFDPLQQNLLMTSSGQAAYSTIESFLMREILPAEGRVLTCPYIYFEAFEQLSELPHLLVEQADEWSPESIITRAEQQDSHVVFIDPVANIAQMPTFDFQKLADLLTDRDWSHRWLVIDGTMVSAGINPFLMFSKSNHPNVLYYESASKYLQLGLDLQMAGVIISEQRYGPDLAKHRRNLGTGLYQGQVSRFPMYDRFDLLSRLRLLTRNAESFIRRLANIKLPNNGLHVAYPKFWSDMGWSHGGGVVAMTFKDEGMNNRPCLDALIEKLIENSRDAGIALTQGVSFGFSTTRVSAAAAIAADTDPFLRFSIGEESLEEIHNIADLVINTTEQFCRTFQRNE